MPFNLPERLVAPGAAANLASYDPDPLAIYISVAGDTLGVVAQRFYGMVTEELLQLLAEANGIRPAAVLPGGVPVRVPQPLWRVAL